MCVLRAQYVYSWRAVAVVVVVVVVGVCFYVCEV